MIKILLNQMLLSFEKIYVRTVCIGKAENCGETTKAVLPCHK